MRKMGSDRDGIKAGGGRARGDRVSGRCDREGHERMAGVFIASMRVAAAILIPMGGIVWRTDGIVSVDRRSQYHYWRRRQLSRAKVTIMARDFTMVL